CYQVCIFQMIMTNITTRNGFLLLGFSDDRKLQILYALLFLVLFLVALTGNFIIITTTTLDQHLQSPMYYFLKQLSLLDLSFISITVPQAIDNSLMDDNYVSYGQCILQVFFFTSLAWTEIAILTIMSYDRYTAICFPLHYEVIMDPRNCRWAVIAAWVRGGISGILYTAATFSIIFCRVKIIHQFFCDVPQLLKLSCSNDYLGVIGVAAFISVVALACFVSIALSYVHTFSTVLRIPSAEGICAHLKPTSDSPSAFDLMVSIFYTVIPPTLNLIIYSLRNEAMK
ncbi:Hypothetical predicted protein, partial [Marmota monax]